MSAEFHLPVSHANTAATLLAEHCQLSKQVVKQAMQKGAVWLEDGKGVRRIRRGNTKVNAGHTLHLYYDEAVLAQQAPTPQLIADEGQYSVWFKPSGMLSQGSKWGDHCTLHRWVESHQPFEQQPQRNALVVHRLDRATCGLMLLAHTKKAAQQLSALFEQRNLQKTYRAIVPGCFPPQQVFEQPIGGKAAYSQAKRLAYQHEQSLVEVTIGTGRKHQIRIHLSEAGFPIVGDRLYGNATACDIDLQLCAHRLAFSCPIHAIERCYELPLALSLSLG